MIKGRVKMTEKPEWGSPPLGASWSGPWQSTNPTRYRILHKLTASLLKFTASKFF